MNLTKENDKLLRNLKDAGCNASMINKFINLQKDNKVKAQLGLLSKQRKTLLDKVHENQKKIDYLDFLIFNLKQEEEKI